MKSGAKSCGSDAICLQNNMYAFRCRGQTFPKIPSAVGKAELACKGYKRLAGFFFTTYHLLSLCGVFEKPNTCTLGRLDYSFEI